MRLILLLSALLSAFAAGVSPARGGEVSAAQVSTLARVVAARAAVATMGSRPVFVIPSVRDVLVVAAFEEAEPTASIPLYANRLRT
jgi:hypothetical protein